MKKESAFEKSDMLFSCITDEIIHIKMKDKRSLADAMCRIQEYYESPFPEIKGKIFTLGQLRAAGSRNMKGVFTYRGGLTYDADWSGFNWPSEALEPFIRGLFDPLTPYEQDIVDALKCKQGRFYVIGTYGEEDPAGAIDHEICHALYSPKDEYKKEVDQALCCYKDELVNLKNMLRYWGYCEEVLDDECHAYISADYDWLFEENEKDIKKFDVSVNKALHLELREIKSRHFKEESNDSENKN